ncbi:MAG: serine hydrolase domain-containing protein [Iamia sp.]
MADLHPLPDQPAGTPWPTAGWEEASPPAEAADRLPAALDRLIGPEMDPVLGHTNALAVVHRGRIVAERYGEREMGPLAELAGVEPGPISADDPLGSWSMAKSVLHLAVGIAQAQGLVDVTHPAPVPSWQEPADPRGAITWDDLLTMRPGLAWTEVYEGFDDDALPDVITMLYGDGADDMAAFAAEKPLVHPPGTPEAYLYSSGTTNIVADALRRALDLEPGSLDDWVRAALLDPIGITTATFGHDGAGLWAASSYVDMIARDWLRLGLMVLRGGLWSGAEVVPPAWIDHGRTPRSPDEDIVHGAHWWARPDRSDGTFMAHGFEGQRLMMVPDRDLVVFRQGKTPAADKDILNAHLLALIDLFPLVSSA